MTSSADSSIPHFDTETGILSVQEQDGNTHHYHTDPEESAESFRKLESITRGAALLREMLDLRIDPSKPGFLDEPLLYQWVAAVTAPLSDGRSGLDKEEALYFLCERLEYEISNDRLP